MCAKGLLTQLAHGHPLDLDLTLSPLCMRACVCAVFGWQSCTDKAGWYNVVKSKVADLQVRLDPDLHICQGHICWAWAGSKEGMCAEWLVHAHACIRSHGECKTCCHCSVMQVVFQTVLSTSGHPEHTAYAALSLLSLLSHPHAFPHLRTLTQAAGFTHAWLPPPSNSPVSAQGYMPVCFQLPPPATGGRASCHEWCRVLGGKWMGKRPAVTCSAGVRGQWR